jgi:MoaA/NifB/PqqE/SkfB family radical SAM enzyme
VSPGVTFFPDVTPAEPSARLGEYKRALARAAGAATAPDADPVVWRLDPANASLLGRAVSELAARGVRRMRVVLAAEDVDEHTTDVAAEGGLVPALRAAEHRRPDTLEVALALSTGRPYVLPPPALDVSTNDLCGLKCVMCANRNVRRDPHTISPETVRDLVTEAAAWGIRRVALTGAGEPFRDPEMLDHVELASSLGHLVNVTTNGLPVSESVAARLARVHASVSVSIHGADLGTHDRITGAPGSAEHAWAAVRRLVRARDSTPGSRLSVAVSTVIQRANVSQIEALVRRSRSEGCDRHNLQPVNLQHGSLRDGRVLRRDDDRLMAELWPASDQAPELDRLFGWLVEYRRGGGPVSASPERLELFRRYFADPSREALSVSCLVGERFLAVDHRGRIRPCYRLPWDMGDARLRGVRRVWNSVAYSRVRAIVASCPLTCMNNCFFRSPEGGRRPPAGRSVPLPVSGTSGTSGGRGPR